MPSQRKSRAGTWKPTVRNTETKGRACKISKRGDPTGIPNRPPNFKHVHWLVGGTLQRLHLLELVPNPKPGKPPEIGTLARAAVREPTPLMLRVGCDRCTRQHGTANSRCSPNWIGYTHCTQKGVMYNFQTGEPLAEVWKLVEDIRAPRARTFLQTFKRIK